MNETRDGLRAAQQARMHALIVPREHGAWGLLLVPLFTGVVAGFASEHRIWPLLTFTVAALTLFWLRTPVESLIGTGSPKAETKKERWTAFVASAFLAALAIACLTALMWKGQNLQLLLLGGVTAFAFLVQSVLRSLGRKTRMAAQLVGAIGLVCTAPAAYYRQPDSFRAIANSLCPRRYFFSESCVREILLAGAAGVVCVVGDCSFLAYAPSLGDRRFCSRTRSRNSVVLSKTGTPGCQALGLVRDEAWNCIWSPARSCFHLFVSTHPISDASDEAALS